MASKGDPENEIRATLIAGAKLASGDKKLGIIRLTRGQLRGLNSEFQPTRVVGLLVENELAPCTVMFRGAAQKCRWYCESNAPGKTIIELKYPANRSDVISFNCKSPSTSLIDDVTSGEAARHPHALRPKRTPARTKSGTPEKDLGSFCSEPFGRCNTMSSKKHAALPSDSYSASDLDNVAFAVAASGIRLETLVEKMKNLKEDGQQKMDVQKAAVNVKTEASHNQEEKGQEAERLVRERSVREDSLSNPDLVDENENSSLVSSTVMSTVSGAVTVEETVNALNSMSREELMSLSLHGLDHLLKDIDDLVKLRERELALEQRKHHLEQLMKRLGISNESQDDVVKKEEHE